MTKINKAQIQASDPSNSVWVAASAGTGKTKILTDRVLRLLLSGAHFNKILCLTFTNAAANEMEERINTKLKQWSLNTDNILSNELNMLLSRLPTKEEMTLAKLLYVTYLNNTDNKIAIYTIHSFCQKVLKKFPIEAGVVPSFQILEQLTLQQLVKNIFSNLLKQRNVINEFLISNFHMVTLENILLQIISHKLAFKQYFTKDNVDFQIRIKKLHANKKILMVWSKQSVLEISYYIQEIKEINDEKLNNIKLLCEQDNNLNDIEKWFSIFLTKDGQLRKKILNEKIKKLYPELNNVLNKLQKQLYDINEINNTIEVCHYTYHLLEFTKKFIEAYDEEKQKLNYLDFDDLIFYTNKLLSTGGVRDWVLYKLDGGIEHILIDESQDTSQNQWEIIKNLIEEFYAGEGANIQNRTIFVVGDEKQSIFSFQGADLCAFHNNHNFFSTQLTNIGKQLNTITLEYSYRSLSSILDLVYTIFSDIKNKLPNLFKSVNTKILPIRELCVGRVELWPLVVDKKQPDFFWSVDYNNDTSSVQALSKQIASYIKKIITTQEILPSTKKPVEYKDILIIVRKRDNLVKEIIEQLKIHDLPNTGMDRVVLHENLSVLDLISIAKFVLNPYDDLNLAELLKSPVLNLSDKIIQGIILSNQSDKSLWEKLQYYPQYCVVLKEFIELSKITNASNFFHYILDYLTYRELLINSIENNNFDAINELLFMSYNYANNVNHSLLSFIYWFDENKSEVKCEVDAHNKIRIMTVHNAKGLQAPIVILADTTTVPNNNQDKFFWYTDQQVYTSSPNSSNCKFFTNIKSTIEHKQLEEYLRLLYVALTRAEDILIICGCSTSTEKIRDKSWYSLVDNTFNKLKIREIDGKLIYQTNYDHAKIEDISDVSVTESISVFVDNKIIDNDLIKSNIDNIFTKYSSNKTYFQYSHDYFIYGKILHKIFEDSIKSKKISLLTKHPLKNTLPQRWLQQLEFIMIKLNADHNFISLLQYDVKTELNIGIKQDDIIKIARIDLMIIAKKDIIIIDYKSDYDTSLETNKYATSYIKQLSDYYQIIKQLYPLHNIICKIFWLSSAEFRTVINTTGAIVN